MRAGVRRFVACWDFPTWSSASSMRASTSSVTVITVESRLACNSSRAIDSHLNHRTRHKIALPTSIVTAAYRNAATGETAVQSNPTAKLEIRSPTPLTVPRRP